MPNNTELEEIPIWEVIEELKEEVELRRSVYWKKVKKKQMKYAEMKRKINRMRRAIQILKELKEPQLFV
jgi:hypothetical protein